MAKEEPNPSFEEIFNRNLDALLDARGLEYRDLLDLLEASDYTPDTPATVLLNDAVAMAAVLGVSPLRLLVPDDDEPVAVTPGIAAQRRLLSLWLRGMRPLRDEDFTVFHREAAREDLDADQVAENWVWSERLRTAGLATALNDAVDQKDLERVKELSDLAARMLNQQALERADRRVPRAVKNGQLQAAVTRATRFRRQVVPPKPSD